MENRKLNLTQKHDKLVGEIKELTCFLWSPGLKSEYEYNKFLEHRNDIMMELRELHKEFENYIEEVQLLDGAEYFSECDICCKDINIGDEYYNLGGEHIHKECIDEYLDTAEKDWL